MTVLGGRISWAGHRAGGAGGAVMRAPRNGRAAGQAIAEFSIVGMVFLVMIIAIVDFGRAIYVYNGLAEAAREIARQTIVAPGATLGTSRETVDSVATQQGMVPGMSAPTFACVDMTGAATGHSPCRTGDYVRVTTTASYSPSILLGLTGPMTLASSATMYIP